MNVIHYINRILSYAQVLASVISEETKYIVLQKLPKVVTNLHEVVNPKVSYILSVKTNIEINSCVLTYMHTM